AAKPPVCVQAATTPAGARRGVRTDRDEQEEEAKRQAGSGMHQSVLFWKGRWPSGRVRIVQLRPPSRGQFASPTGLSCQAIVQSAEPSVFLAEKRERAKAPAGHGSSMRNAGTQESRDLFLGSWVPY